jgi:hypothetical protein
VHNKWIDVLFVVLVLALAAAYLLVPQRLAQIDAAAGWWRDSMPTIMHLGG